MLEPGEDYEIGDSITDNIYNISQEFEYINFGNYIVYSNEKQEDTKVENTEGFEAKENDTNEVINNS